MGKAAYSPCASGAVMLSNVQGNAYVFSESVESDYGQGDRVIRDTFMTDLSSRSVPPDLRG